MYKLISTKYNFHYLKEKYKAKGLKKVLGQNGTRGYNYGWNRNKIACRWKRDFMQHIVTRISLAEKNETVNYVGKAQRKFE